MALLATPAALASGSHLHDARYCEILVLRGAPPTATVTVWNTIGLNKCPPKWWRGFDAASLARELGAKFVVLNGARHFLMDSATASTVASAPSTACGCAGSPRSRSAPP